MTDMPHWSKPVTGRPLHTAPKYLLGWLDTVTGAFATGGIIGEGGKQTHAMWTFVRGEETVGNLVIDITTGEALPCPR